MRKISLFLLLPSIANPPKLRPVNISKLDILEACVGCRAAIKCTTTLTTGEVNSFTTTGILELEKGTVENFRIHENSKNEFRFYSDTIHQIVLCGDLDEISV